MSDDDGHSGENIIDAENSDTHKLRMSFDPKTIEHLGINMYSHLPNAIAELVANAYDADAGAVYITLKDDGNTKSIEVIDDGFGMDFDEINNKFLRIGRNRRNDGNEKSPGGRKATGKKGLGKLALFGLCDVIDIKTVKDGSDKEVRFTLDRNALKATEEGKDYEPKFTELENSKAKGTEITLKNLKRKTPFDKEGVADSLARLFDCFGENFKCYISLNGVDAIEVDNKRRFRNIDRQFSWKLPKFIESIDSNYVHKGEIRGEIISTQKPIKPNLRGITLFANGRLVNAAEFFGIPTSSHVFSYLTGWLDVDFVDEITEDVIATNRQSLHWDSPALDGLQPFLEAMLRKIIADWRTKRKEANKKETTKRVNIDKDSWLANQSERTRPLVLELLDIASEPDDEDDNHGAKILKFVHGNVLTEYAERHWRHLHKEIQDASDKYYKGKNYHDAVSEAIKRYVNTIRGYCLSISPHDDNGLMGNVFGIGKTFSVAKKYKKPDGTDFNKGTLENIENGQRDLSQAVLLGCRNPIAHEEQDHLRNSGLFADSDCLDSLSLLSHLFRRLDDAIEVHKKEEAERGKASD